MKYDPGTRFIDEMFTPDGQVRPHYEGVRAYLEQLGVPTGIRLVPALGYLDFIALQDGARLVLTIERDADA